MAPRGVNAPPAARGDMSRLKDMERLDPNEVLRDSESAVVVSTRAVARGVCTEDANDMGVSTLITEPKLVGDVWLEMVVELVRRKEKAVGMTGAV